MQARRYVEAPAGTTLPFGLASAALVIPDGDSHLGMGVQYQTLACSLAHLTRDECIAALEEFEGFTADDGKELVVADAFTIYALHRCRPVAGAMDTADADALTRLSTGFNRAVEEGFEADSLGDADDLTPTPGTPVHPMAGLAILEEYAAGAYGGVPVVHITRGTGTLLTQMGAVGRQGTRLETEQGAYVASGGGYGNLLTVGTGEDATTSDDSTRWMRVTGAVTIRKGAAQSFGGRLRRDGSNQYVNEFQALAEQPVVVTAECINAAVLVHGPETFWGNQ